MLNQSPKSNEQHAFEANSGEIEPWLVVLGESEQGSLAMWRLSGEMATRLNLAPGAERTLAMFSTEQHASDYADKNCSGTKRIVQVDRTRLLSVMVDCFRQGIRYATLNPGDSTAHSLFVLRDVLSAAKRELTKLN